MSGRASQTRLFCSLGVICCYMICLVVGTSYNYGFEATKDLKHKRQTSDFIVTAGMPLNEDGSVPIRREIRDLQQDPDRWALYILALDMMQYTDQSDQSSWFAITGIHGVPFEPWGGVQATAGNQNSGYCAHETILFPTWHRAYMALYEQELCARAQYIATLYPDDLRSHFEAAAADCRAPYFDWAALPSPGESVLPDSVGGSPQINISGPAGSQVIANPLFTYEFKPPNSDVFLNVTPWADWDSTRRAPLGTDADAPSNDSAVNQNLVDHLVQNQQRLYNLFSSYDNYTLFSNEGWAEDTSQYDSLESLHDNVHAMLGGSDGHMTIVPFSAFDPVFVLHHVMIDRLLALWQVLHPNSWISPEVARTNSYTTSVGDVLDASSALTPFYASSNGTFWNSDMLRDPISLGYTYPEMSGISLSNMASVLAGQSAVAASINRLYGTYSMNSIKLNSKYSRLSRSTRRYHQNGNSFAVTSRQASMSQTVDKLVSDENQYREWIANIRVKKQALDGPFSVHLDLAEGNTHIGTMGVFASPPAVANLMKMAPGAEYISSAVPMTKHLIDKVSDETLSSLDPEDVGEYLTKNLQITITKSDGSEVKPEDVSGLSIKAVSFVVQATASEEHLPEWAQPDYELTII
ncbi:hypothetical protein N0V93_001350 [Gnomoniopsis smithogilvyi]|uniref:Tyrosinase copper-binding domain-containing protein n=1 Tax=Gnomoniopsis smithogilvyi TaxID=1191159 RepID=A0A9W8Z3C7_9PEZI|nr:hypothetical protein N0V93_001350 [Gnomoniopsis smithogilvyi]